MNIISFDIEISDIFELLPGESMDDYAPLHPSIASTAIMDGGERLWYSTDTEGTPIANMRREKAHGLLEYLFQRQDDGDMVCAWNGLGFDLRWIGFAADEMELAWKVALRSYDPMFQFFNQRGFPVSLKSVGMGMGIREQKLMDGADAPKEWKAGNYQAVMDYVMGDSRITNKIVSEIIKRGEIKWITKKGSKRTQQMSELKTVEEVLRDPEPNQSWMDKPLKRANFIQWNPFNVK